ncbi:MAG TPA: glycosyltransferase family 2 protein [Cyclobacteriaceae bacterium]|nr:glycosyltransferase family 2 protein [Cyclobacteriaceae bacterium]
MDRSQGQTPDVSIIIVNYNTFELTCACVESIIALTKEARYEIIIIDNASTQCDPDQFKQRYPGIRLVRNTTNVGFGIANNQGMAIARGTYFLLINSDCYLLNDAIDLAFRFARERPETGVFGATLLNEDGSHQTSHYRAATVTLLSPVRSVLLMNPLLARILRTFPTRKNSAVGGLYGAYIWLHRSVYEKVGGFDPDFFMYCEDTEWFRNRIGRSFGIEICEEARICHLGGRSGGLAIVNPQNVLSYYLYWYKMGKPHFWLYTIGSIFNLVFVWLALPFMKKTERRRNMAYSEIVLRLLPKLLFDIPRYSNRFGSRKAPLRLAH